MIQERIKKPMLPGNHNGGYTLVELIVVMAMMALLGTTLLAVVNTGGNQYERIHTEYKTENEARIALSFITVKIRQNDQLITETDHAVSVITTPNALKIFDSPTTWWQIEMSGGALLEHRFSAADPMVPNATATIADQLDSVVFTSTLLGHAVEIDITYTIDGKTKHLKQTAYLRAY